MSETDTIAVPRSLLTEIIKNGPMHDYGDGSSKCHFCDEEEPEPDYHPVTGWEQKVDDEWGRKPTDPMWGHAEDCVFFRLKSLLEDSPHA